MMQPEPALKSKKAKKKHLPSETQPQFASPVIVLAKKLNGREEEARARLIDEEKQYRRLLRNRNVLPKPAALKTPRPPGGQVGGRVLKPSKAAVFKRPWTRNDIEYAFLAWQSRMHGYDSDYDFDPVTECIVKHFEDIWYKHALHVCADEHAQRVLCETINDYLKT